MKIGGWKFHPVLFLIPAIYAAVFIWLGNYGSFWSEDGGVKYLQARSLVRSNWTDASIGYPGRELDPGLEFNPLAGTHTYVRNGSIYSIYPLAFPFLSSLSLALIGSSGLYLLPLLATLALLVIIYRLGGDLFGPAAAAGSLLTAALASPLFFYAFTFWEINPAVLLSTAGFYLGLRSGPGSPASKLLAAGALMGGAVFFRSELILLPAAYLAVRATVRKDRRGWVLLVAGAFLAAAGFLLLQYLTEGGMLTHLLHNISVRPGEFAPANLAGYKWGLIREQLWAADPDPRIGLFLILPAAVLGLLLLSARRPFLRGAPIPLILSAAGIAYLVYLARSLFGDYPIRSTPFNSGLLPFSPWVVFALRPPRRGDRLPRELFWTAALFIPLLVLAVPTSGGLQWGPRYLVPAYPLLIPLVWGSFLRLRRAPGGRRWLTAGFIGLLAAGVLHQAGGLRLLRGKKAFNRAVMEKVLRDPAETVIARPWWVPLSLAAAFPEKEFLTGRDPIQLSRLLSRLREAGREEFILIVEADPRLREEPPPLPFYRPAGMEQVDSGIDAYFSLLLLRYRRDRGEEQ